MLAEWFSTCLSAHRKYQGTEGETRGMGVRAVVAVVGTFVLTAVLVVLAVGGFLLFGLAPTLVLATGALAFLCGACSLYVLVNVA